MSNTHQTKKEGYIESLKKIAAGFLMFGVLMMSGPVQVAFSEEGAPPQETASTTEAQPQDTSITTGNAVAENTTTNAVNTSDTSVNQPTGDSQATPGDDVCDDLDLPEGCPEGNAQSSADTDSDLAVTASTTNDALVENTSTTTAETGENAASAGGAGDATVDTGHSLAASNVINVVNTNMFNSDGMIMLLNMIYGVSNVDLRDSLSFFDGEGNAPTSCSLETCETPGTELKVVNNNSAEVVNDIVVRSATGKNMAAAESGDAKVKTGNAYAAANLVNVVNSNFINSNYLLLTVNNFGNLNGDIVLPGKSFFEQFFAGNGGVGGGDTTIANNNDATVDNNVGVGAETGNNTASTTDGSALVTTGNSAAGANIFNHVNGNYIGGGSIFFLLRIHGNWAGEIFNAPAGISWAETPMGIQLYSDPGEGGSSAGGSTLQVGNENKASVINNVNVLALTGENKVSSTEGNTEVATGDAVAAANVINVVNTNVVGRNWIFAVLNVFGDWNGNLSFGKPDLWVGGVAGGGGTVEEGSNVTYKFTISNQGDADASNVTLRPAAVPHLRFNNPGPWKIGSIKAGETIEVSYGAKVTGSLPVGTTPVTLSVTGSGAEGDNNMLDNTEEVTLELTRTDRATIGAVRPDAETLSPMWNITKTSSASTTIPAGSSVTYTIVIQNDGGPGYHSILEDTLKDAAGNVVKVNKWNLETVLPGEEIRITYTMAFGSAMKPGLYTNEAHVLAQGGSSAPQYSVNANSGIAKAAVELGPPVPPAVHKLELSNVRITAIGANRDTALVEWDTNVPATSKVVFGDAAGEYEFDIDDGEHFGYPLGTSQDNVKMSHHQVLITGLKPGTAYKYRAVSFASPGVGSDEYSFALSKLSKPAPAVAGPLAVADIGAEEDDYSDAAPLAIDGWSGATNYESTDTGDKKVVTMVPTSSLMNLAAAIGAAGDGWFSAVSAALAALFFLILFGRQREQHDLKNKEQK